MARLRAIRCNALKVKRSSTFEGVIMKRKGIRNEGRGGVNEALGMGKERQPRGKK